MTREYKCGNFSKVKTTRNTKSLIGRSFNNKSGDLYTVLRQDLSKLDKVGTYWFCKFPETGYEISAHKANIVAGVVSDPTSPNKIRPGPKKDYTEFMSKTYTNTRGAQFLVTEKVPNPSGKGYAFRVRFIKSGFETISEKQRIVKGNIVDPSAQTILGGANTFIAKGDPRRKLSFFAKAKNRFLKMHYRCYDPEDKRYADYGGCGVYVCERWHSFSNYLDDYQTLENADKALVEKGWEIDKDLKEGSYYGPDTCIWIPKALNTLLANNLPTLVDGTLYLSTVEARTALRTRKYSGEVLSFSDPRVRSELRTRFPHVKGL